MAGVTLKVNREERGLGATPERRQRQGETLRPARMEIGEYLL